MHLVAFEDHKYCLKEYVVGSAAVFRQEVRLLHRLQHPNILQLQGLLWNEAQRRAYLQFPWCLCTMKDWLKTQPSDENIRMMTSQVNRCMSTAPCSNKGGCPSASGAARRKAGLMGPHMHAFLGVM